MTLASCSEIDENDRLTTIDKVEVRKSSYRRFHRTEM